MYSKHRLAELRNLYNETHSFFKNGNEIYISNKSADEDFVIGDIVERSTYGDSSVTSSLIKHLFFRTFRERFLKYITVDSYPLRFFSKQLTVDIIYIILFNELKNKL